MKTKLAKFKICLTSQIAPINGEIHIVGAGRNAYLWIGNYICIGTLSGQKTLQKLAKNILKTTK